MTSPKTKAEENRERYESSKESRNAYKARMYRENIGGYRDRALARRREQLARLKKERAQHRDDLDYSKTPGQVKSLLIDGTTVRCELLTLSKVANHLGVATVTLRKWLGDNVMPEPTYRSKGGHRLYTIYQVEAMVEVVSEHRTENKRWRLDESFVKKMHSACHDGLVNGVPQQVIDNEKDK